MKAKYLFLLFVMHCSLANAQEALPVGARSWGMGNASATSTDIWSVMNNQGALGRITKTSIGFFAENMYQLKDLSRGSLALAIPGKSGVFGLGITSWGGALNRQQFGLAYGKMFGKSISAGIKMNYLVTNQPESYGRQTNLLVEAGILYEAGKNLLIGLHIYNPNEVTFSSKLNEKLPGMYKMGLQYKFSDKVNAAVEGYQHTHNGFSLRSGIEYRPVEKYVFRTGFSTNPVHIGFGFGFVYRNTKLDLSANYMETLGFSPRLSAMFELVRSKSREVMKQITPTP